MKRKRPTRVESERIARRVVHYYVNNANRSRQQTVRYFTKIENLPRSSIHGIVKKYERDGKVEWKNSRGRPAKVSGPENMEKLRELLLLNPSLSVREAAHLLKINTQSVHKMLLLARGQLPKTIRKKRRNENSVRLTSESSSSILDATNSVENGNRTYMESTGEEYHFNDDVIDQFADSFFDDHGNDNDDPVEHDAEEKVWADIDLETPTVKIKRKVKGKAKPVVGKVCVICLDKKADYNRTKSSHVTTFEENMRIIYLLKNVLKISSEELVKMMKATKGENPVDWVDMCEECYEIVHEAMIAHQQLQTLQKTIVECKSKIVLKLKESLSQPRKKEKAVKQNVVSKQVREVLSKSKVDSESNTRKSESKVNSCVEVKMQVEKVEVTLDQPESEQNHGDWFDDAATDFDMPECQNEAEESEVVDKALEIGGGTHEESKKTDDNGVPVVVTPVVLPVPKVSVICDLCGESIGKVSLAVHKFKTHGVVMEGFSVLRCEVSGCKYETLFESLMKTHMRIHLSNRPRPFVCLFCGKSFITSKDLKRHEDIHRNAETKPYQCDICGKGFAVDTLLYRHKRMTHFGRKFPSSSQRTRSKT